MKPRDAKKRFNALLKEQGHPLKSLAPGPGIEAMLEFYRKERAEECDLDQDGDMLLFQWGCNDWGEGEFFELDLTRQFIYGSGEDDHIRQLHLTFQFEPTESLREIEDGNRWCHSPRDLADFRAFIESSQAIKLVEGLVACSVTLESEAAG